MENNHRIVKAVIFDMDGTILDSSEMWDTVAENVIMAWGYVPKPTIREDVLPLGFLDMAPYLKNEYKMSESIDEINEAISQRTTTYYTKEAQLKPGALELMKTMKAKGIKLGLLTATSHIYAEPAMRLVGAWELFDAAISCAEIGYTKFGPEPFQVALERLGTTTEDTWVFEDALYAVETAKGMGMRVCAIADSAAAFQWKDIQKTADCCMDTFHEWPEVLPFADQLK